MNRFKNIDKVSFDSMIIIYYCFNFKDNKLIELSDKAQLFTEKLIKNNSKIIVPSFILSEIKQKETLQIINRYISSNQITNLPKNPNMAFKLGLEYKFKNKVNKMMKKDWVIISDYSPSEALIEQIHDFFKI